MIDRRTFFKTMGAATGSLASGWPISLYSEEEKKKLERIGIQLYTLRDDMARDFEGTLKNVAELGYKQGAFARELNHPPADVRAILDRVHLDAPSAHIGTPA